MTSAGFVQAYMSRADRSMPMSVAPSMSTSMSSMSRGIKSDDRQSKKRRRKGQNIVITCAADINRTSKRDLVAVISYIARVHDVVVRCHRDVLTRRADVQAVWRDSWAPIVVEPRIVKVKKESEED